MTIGVFVADDNPDTRWAIIDHLAHTQGFDVVPPEVARRDVAYKMPREIEPTLNLIYSYKPAVVVMDISWSHDRNAGIRASRLIKDRVATTRVLLYSHYVETDLVVEAVLEGGVDGYVSKDDYPSYMLLEAIRTVQRGLPYFVPEVVDRLLKIVRKDVKPDVVDRILTGLQGSYHNSPTPIGQQLTKTEADVLKHLARGKSNAAIARALSLGDSSVKGYVHNIYQKLGVSEVLADPKDVAPRVMAVLIGVRQGYVKVEDLASAWSASEL